MITLRNASDRGRANFGWLDAKHSFSFGHYYDPEHMGFSALRVINDDRVQPGAGFDTHGHQNMEIITFVTKGTIAHKDSEGNVKSLPAGEFQLMSAGQGIYHSEFNGSQTEELNLLQIWIEPNQFDTKPDYQQKDFGKETGITTIATPDGRDNTLHIKQDATLHQLILEPSQSITLETSSSRKTYIHLVSGNLALDEFTLSPGDGAKVELKDKLALANHQDEKVVALIFDLP